MKDLEEYLINNFNKLKINSNDVLNGDIFLALLGSKNHGNDYIDEVLIKKAKYIITDKEPHNYITNHNIFIFKDTLKFLHQIAIKKRGLYKGKVIGITGSAGKTSVKENLKYLLQNYYKISVSIKSYNNYLGVLISILNLDLNSKFAIFEIGINNFNEIKILVSLIMPSQTIITNILPTHLEKLINTRNIALEKLNIFNKKFNPKIELTILSNYNKDEKFLIKKAEEMRILNVISIGKKLTSNLKILDIRKINELYFKVYLNYKNKNFNFVISKNQLHRINNILICFVIFVYNNIDLEFFYELSKSIPLLKGRGLEKKINFNKQKIKFIDESYNASPYTMRKSIEYFYEINLQKNQNKFLVLGEMNELGKNALNFHIDIIKYILDKNIENVIICGELMQIALKKTYNTNIKCFMNIKSILLFLKINIKNNDILMIKGSNSSLSNKLTEEILIMENK